MAILLFIYHSLQIKIVQLLERRPAKISWERNAIKWATKLSGYKKENIGLCACAKTKKDALLHPKCWKSLF